MTPLPSSADDEKKPPPEEEEAVEPDPARLAERPIPTVDELRAALEWAFVGEDAPPAVLDAYARHALYVQEKNREFNLTNILEPREIAAKHYLDSWRSVRLLPLIGRKVLDLGSGAGYPGVPIALAEPNCKVVLLDSIEKKGEFLGSSVRDLGIRNASAVCDRAEEHLARNKYDTVFVRAVSSVRENVRLLRKVRHSMLDLVMLKGPSWSREVRAAERESERLGFRLDTVWEHKLPGEMGARAVLIYRAPGAQGR